MSNTNAVPSAEEFHRKLSKYYFWDDIEIKEINYLIRLHLEAMRDELINTQYGPTRESINYIANNYIKNNKL